MSDTNLDKIPKIDGSNYHICVDQIKNILMMSQLWMIVSGTEMLKFVVQVSVARSSKCGNFW